MTDKLPAFESAMDIHSEPGNSGWLEAFYYLSKHPDTAQMIQTFTETLEDMVLNQLGLMKRIMKSATAPLILPGQWGLMPLIWIPRLPKLNNL